MSKITYVSFLTRLAAGLIDTVVLSLFFGIIFLIGYLLSSGPLASEGRFGDIISVVFFATFIFIPIILLGRWLYYALLWSSKHQATIGMMVLGIKVVDYNHQRISFLQATGRYLAASLNFLIGYLAIVVTEKKQALHDFIASTYVVKKEG